MVRRRRPPRAGALTELPPLRIFSQIVMLQIIYYISACALILFSALVAGRHFTLDLVLNWRSLRGDTAVGWTLGVVWISNSVVGVIAMLILIQRSKLILDFALTLHFIHLLVVSFYSHSLPRNLLWWALQVISSGIMTALGVWSCQWRELRPINFGTVSNTVAEIFPNISDRDHDLTPERGRGRGRDEHRGYELVGIQGKHPERET
ncbi:hypothetical protein K3495_g11736 [Podosphaera aphanis]|nr:hypothetical protein K3495_g11736 [Podosphaera aphanis]